VAGSYWTSAAGAYCRSPEISWLPAMLWPVDVSDVQIAGPAAGARRNLHRSRHRRWRLSRRCCAPATGWLVPDGLLLLTAGHGAWTGSQDDWLGGGAAMWWSVIWQGFVSEGTGGNSLFWARRAGPDP